MFDNARPRRLPAGQSAILTAILCAAACAAGPAFAQSPQGKGTPPLTSQQRNQPAVSGKPATVSTAVSNEPQRTTASFGDWVLRCERPSASDHVCEVAQAVATPQGQMIAQIALGRPSRGEDLRLTALVPSNVTLATPARFAAAEPGSTTPAGTLTLDLAWRRCLAGSCIADAAIGAESMKQLRNRVEPSRITFQDGTGRETAIPFSPKGLPQALEALGREEPR